jgi:photosystem II stability/assembly factor-like uncharacterized protein
LLIVNDLQGILRTDLDGVRIGEWSSDQYGEYTLGHVDATVTANDYIYILHQFQAPAVRVKTFRGDWVASWGQMAAIEPGKFVFPTGIAADLRGRLFVIDSDNRSQSSYAPLFSSRVQIFDEQGQYLVAWGSFGGAAGQFVSPQGVAALSDGRIVVADTGNNRLQVFAPDGPLPERTPLPDPASYGPTLPAIGATWHDRGPVGGSPPTTLAIPPTVTSDHPIVAGYADDGLAASTDGVHWTRLPGRYPGGDFTADQFAYAGREALVAWGNGIDAPQRSTDLGSTWTRLGDALVYGIAPIVFPSPTYDSDSILYALTRSFWRSSDRGDSWEPRGLANIEPVSLAAAVDSGGVPTLLVGNRRTGSLWGGSLYGILRSTDDGLTWQRVYTEPARSLAFSPAFAQDRTAFAICSYGSDPKLLRSTDGGISWVRVASLQCPSNDACYGLALSPAYGTDHTLAVWTSAGNSYLSTDAGETWSPLGSTASGIILRWIIFAPTYPQDHRIWRLEPGRADGFQVTTDNGLSWQVAGEMPGATMLGLAGAGESGGTVWGTTPYGLLATEGAGISWTWPYTYTSSDVPGRVALARSPTFETDGTAIVYKSMTTDGGASWQPLSLSSDLQNLWSIGAAFAPDYSQSHVITLVWDAGDWKYSEFTITTDGGANWQRFSVPVALARAIAFDPTWPVTNTIYVGGEGGLAYSNDLGRTWQRSGNPVASLKVVALVNRMEGNEHVLYAATSTRGVWRSTNGGQTWAELNRGLPNGHACALAQGADDLLAVGLCDGGVYARQNQSAAWRRLGDPLLGAIQGLLIQGSADLWTVWAGTEVGVFRTSFTVSGFADAPMALASLSVATSGNDVMLSWPAVTKNGRGRPISGVTYNVYRATDDPYFSPAPSPTLPQETHRTPTTVQPWIPIVTSTW